MKKAVVLLSGGLDSSAIACLAAREQKQVGGIITTVSSVLEPDFVEKDISDLRTLISVSMEEQRVFFANEMGRYIGAVIEESKSQFKALYEHPVFTNYKT